MNKDEDAGRQVPKTVYHYTDQAGLLGIVQSKVIWATKIQFLSDQNELRHAAELAEPVLRALGAKADSKHEEGFFDHLANLVTELTRFDTYICSFSANPDVLSQWRAYSPHGTGYALGFDTETLSFPMKEQHFRLADCRYDEGDQLQFLELVGKVASERFRKGLDATAPPEGPHDFDRLNATRNFVIDFALSGPMIKHSGFREEAEWRMISYPYADLDSDRLKVRPGQSFPLPYYEFQLTAPSEPLLLNELVIGPCPDPDLAEFAVKELFRPHGDVLCNSIRSSRIPYRNW